MPAYDFPDDSIVEAILSGRGADDAFGSRRPGDAFGSDRPEEERFDPLVEFARDVRACTDRPAPSPTLELAGVLMAGFPTDKGGLLVTAGSNVNGPARQVAGLPKWRKERTMIPATGFLSGLIGKIVAGACAGLVGVTAAGVAGALPGPAQDAVSRVIEAVTPFDVSAGEGEASIAVSVSPGLTTPSVSIDLGTDSTGGTTTSASTGVSTPTAAASTSTSAAATTPNLPSPTAELPDLPGGGLPSLDSLPIPACVKDIVDLETGQLKVPLSQISAQVVNCVRTLISTSGVQLPAGLSTCIDSVLNMATSAAGGSVPSLSGFNFGSCVPVDMSACMSSVTAMLQNLPGGAGGIGNLGGFSGLLNGSLGSGGTNTGATAGSGTSVPGVSGFDLSSCMPFNLDGCLASIFDMAANLPGLGLDGVPGLGEGTVPSVGSLDLGGCVPFGSLSAIPGMPNLNGWLPF